jgi:AbrB family looped-hinge helix DNA binding protein
MKTTVSSKGQMVIPSEIRKSLGIEAGSQLEISVPEPGVLRAEVVRPKIGKRYKIKIHPKSGLPYFDAPDAPKITSADVRKALEDFP